MSISLQGEAKGASKSKVSYLKLGTTWINKQVAWLKVTMHNASFMAVEKADQQLFHKMLHLRRWERASVFVEVLFHI
jgi:hypothetical protein